MVEGPFKEKLAAFTDQLSHRVTDSPTILNSIKGERSRLQNSFFGIGRLFHLGSLAGLNDEIRRVEARTTRYDKTLTTLRAMKWFDAKPLSDPRAFDITARVKHPDSALVEELHISLKIPPDYNPSKAQRDLLFQGKEGTPGSDDHNTSIISIHKAATLAGPYTNIIYELFFQNPQPAAEVIPQPDPQPVSV